MKVATYVSGDTDRVGVVRDGKVYGLREPRPMTEVVADGLDALLAVGQQALDDPFEVVDLADAQLRAAIRPPQMRDSMCFHEHIRNGLGAAEFDDRHKQYPTFYFSNAQAVIGPQDDAAISPGCENFDYELEVAAVIGKPGTNIRPEDADQHIVGYTIYIDWSARDLQMDEMALRLGPAKGKDGATTLGPFLVTADEFEPFRKNKGFDRAMTVAINGEPFSSGNWSTIDWTFNDVVAYTSRGTTLASGDVLGSGTVGRGCLLEHYRLDPDGFRGWLKAGDEITFSVEGIGEMTQKVVPALERHPLSSGH